MNDFFEMQDSLITELAELTQEKSCEGCSQLSCYIYDDVADYGIVEKKEDFYCNQYTPKG